MSASAGRSNSFREIWQQLVPSSVLSKRNEEDAPSLSLMGSRSDGEKNGKVTDQNNGPSGVGQSYHSRSRKLRPVRYDVNDDGYCAHHNHIRLLRQTDDGNWATIRKKCPECIKEDCPAMWGEERLTADDSLGPASSSTATDVSDLLEEADNDGVKILLRRPDRISVSYWSPSERRGNDVAVDRSRILTGLQFCGSSSGPIAIHAIHKQHENAATVVSEDGCDIIPISLCVNACALLEDSQHALTVFDVGDVVEYACGVCCVHGRYADLGSSTIINYTGEHDATVSTSTEDKVNDSVDINNVDSNDSEHEDDATTSLIEKIRLVKSDVYDLTVCVSTIPSTKDPIRLCQAIVFFPTKDTMMDPSKETKDGNDSSLGMSTIDNVCFDLGVVFSQRDNRLIIGAVRNKSNGWLNSKGCAIREGDIVVGINGFVTSTMTPEQARQIIHGIVSSRTTNQLSITTISMAQSKHALTRWDIVRKSVVGAMGGTLTVSGTVLYFTPLHPVGHAMALGGVAVLVTEFEAPRRAMVNVKQHFSEGRLKLNEMRRSRREANSDSLQQKDS